MLPDRLMSWEMVIVTILSIRIVLYDSMKLHQTTHIRLIKVDVAKS